MWARNDFEDGFDAYKIGSSTSSPGWVPGCDSAWQASSSAAGISSRGRRHSAASDSGDTGIGTSCSDSVEDHSSSSGTLSFQPLRSQGPIPTAHVMPSPSSSKLSVPSAPTSPWSSCQLPSPLDSPLDMKDPRPVRRWSSLTRLTGQEKSTPPGRPSYRMDPHGSLDRGVLYGYRQDPLYSVQEKYRFLIMLGGTSLPVNTLVKIKEGLLRQRELEIDRQKQQILQLHARIRENELRAQQVLQNQRGRYDDSYLLKDSPYDSPVSSQSPKSQLPERVSPLCRENGELGRKLAAAELEVIHLSEFLKQNTQKYTEDIKKLEEKMKTRDRYISSLKKKCQREQEQNQEKQQRIETLEKYLADLPSLDEVQTQAQQLQEVQGKKQTLEDTVAKQEKTLEENRALLQEKDALIETQSKREKELVAAVQSLQEKVETCLEDGVRLPMLDLKQLERENTRLLEQQSQNKQGCLRRSNCCLSSFLQALEKKLQRERGITQELRKQLLEREEELETLSKTLQQVRLSLNYPQRDSQSPAKTFSRPDEETLNVTPRPLLKEMSLCLLDLKGLCSVLTQRAQGKEPNLALLLGIKSMSCSAEDNEKPLMEDGLQAKLVEVCQLRKDIDELRTLISDRYAQDMGENCVTQ
uniref:Centrosomal protein of 85 kDa-like n=1 Tax=Sinocyclocheilus anshuiensis TaxID=1608454 RepID=A0A671NNT7_9TELE